MAQIIAKRPRILVFATGTKNGGGRGFEKMVENTRGTRPILDADIVGVVSNYLDGGVHERATRLGVPFFGSPGEFTPGIYQALVKLFDADFAMLSGWLKLVAGLDPARTINIHPGPLPRFGGPGMYGRHVHKAVLAAYKRGEVRSSAVTMHFVDEEYDRGPIIHQELVPIQDDDTVETLAKRVNETEHLIQSRVLNLVVHGQIYYQDGRVYRK